MFDDRVDKSESHYSDIIGRDRACSVEWGVPAAGVVRDNQPRRCLYCFAVFEAPSRISKATVLPSLW